MKSSVAILCFLFVNHLLFAGLDKDILIPRLNYEGVPVDQAFEALSELSRQLDAEGEGVNIVYSGPVGDQAPRISLSLRRVSLYDVIRYMTEMAGLYYRIDANAVYIADEPFSPALIETRFYPVQPSFINVIKGDESNDPLDRR